jgi:transcriptional regulator with XRE-family HTH domain
MQGVSIGRAIRALRIRLGLRQADIAISAGVSRSLIGAIERGALGSVNLRRLETVCEVLGASLDVRVRWHGEGLDRLLDEAHAQMVERLVRRLTGVGWECAVEASFNEYGERGSVDVLAWHGSTRSLLVCEVKSILPDAQAALAPLDRKARLGARIARGRGWAPACVSRLLVVADSSTARRRVTALDATFRTAFPVRGVAVSGWFREPVGAISGLMFLPDARLAGLGRPAAGRQRVNRVRVGRKSAG